MSLATSTSHITQWDERALLLLGVLTIENQHGYQINDFIENRLCSVVAMKKPTAYALLERLEKTGAVSVYSEQEGSRPPRKVYAITAAGRELFLELLRENLAHSTLPGFAGEVGLMFLNHLPAEEALASLRERKHRVQALLAGMESVPSHGPTLRIDLAMDHKRAMGLAELAWLKLTIERLAQA